MLVSVLVPIGAGSASAATSELFFSEYGEGSSFNKALEIYNGTGAAVDLSSYSVELYSNGAASASQSVTLSGSLADGDVFVLANGAADPAILAEADLIASAVVNFNGDDAVVLRNSGAVVDVIGQVGFDPGAQWGSGDASTADNTIRRKVEVCAGDTDETDAFDPSVEWDGYPNNTFDGWGAHTADCDGGGGDPDPVAPLINEFVFDHVGADANAFIEFSGDPSTSYPDLTIIEIEGDSTGAGVIDAVLPVGTTNAGGYWTSSEDAENGAVTILLVSNFTGSVGADLDTNNDGVLDSTPWDEILDGVAVSDGGAGDHTYAVTLDPGYDGDSFRVGGASRIPDRADTDTAGDWMRNDFDGAGFPSVFGSPAVGEAYNTPGAVNEAIEVTSDPFGSCLDPATMIHAIQGSGFASPMAGSIRTVEGVVAGDFEGAARLGGFFLQEEDAQVDGDPATSEGIFVFNSGAHQVEVGDLVRVRGTVTEFFALTEITSVTDLAVCGTGLLVTAADPYPWVDNGGLEAVEGMLVTFDDTMFVTDVFNLHTFGEAWLGIGGVIEQPTDEFSGPAADALAAANMLRSVLLDDGSDNSNPDPIPYVHANGTLRVGDSVEGMTAVMSYGFGSYRLQPVESVVFDETNPRGGAPDPGGDLVVAVFNVLNYWTTIGCGFECRGAQTPEQLEVQTEKLVEAIMGMTADVVGLVEIENPPEGSDISDPSDSAHVPITTLLDALNDAEGSEVWAWVGPADHHNAYPIRNEIIYRIGAVEMVGTPTAYADPAFDAVAPSGDPYARPPLAQTFEADGAVFTVVVNHFKSKGSSCNEPGEGGSQGNCNLKRVEEAEALLDFVADLQAIDPDVLVVGDMNSYMEEDPIHTLETELVNLVTAHEADPYSYQFFATFAFPYVGRGSLDHGLATPTMADQVTGAAAWHINADEPRFLDWFDPTITAPGAYRSSDHDPVLFGLDLDGTGPEIVATASPSELWPPNHEYRSVTVDLVVTDDSGSATVELVSVTSSEADSGLSGEDEPNDIVIIDDTHFQLRAERYSPAGRVYTITYRAYDAYGNETIASVEVVVPHDQGEGGPN
jgi:hypothetical protein